MSLPMVTKPRPAPAGSPGWVSGEIETASGAVLQVATRLDWRDRLGAAGVRLGLRRMRYAVSPGLYAVGTPNAESPVFVSANYKLSFDYLRKELGGIDGWILVLDTRGVNVWCAAGKGTFGTEEVIRRVAAAGLGEIVSHRRLILPQLGAPGVAAHEVRQRAGFRVIYGPVRAGDIAAFMAAGERATVEMRRVHFQLADRLAVVPLELVQWGRFALPIAAGFFLLAGVSGTGYALPGLAGGREALLALTAYAGGAALVPALLPWLPGRAISFKGAVLGLLLAAILAVTGVIPGGGVAGGLEVAAWLLLMPSVAAFMAMNYTGATTYTSLSGVLKEMRYAVPAEIAGAVVGLGLWLAAR
ncbi:MAG: mercury methylation corrinoid protein HgcA, partial [Dehalococcoidales bacterium]